MLPPKFTRARRLFRGLASRQRSEGAIEATYDYVDERGQLLFQVVRYAGKRFRQRRPDGAGGWLPRMGDVRRVVYRLADVVGGDRTRPVYVVEGEKDVDRLWQHGQIATCNPFGAQRWRDVADCARQALAGRDVVVIADRDDSGVGQRHAREVEASLRGFARSIRVVAAPPPCKDVSDLFDARPGKDAPSILAELVELDERDEDDRATAGYRYVILCATQRTGSTLVFDDVRNLLGYPPGESERLYHEVFRARRADDWPSVQRILVRENRIRHVVMDKVMFHYTPYLSQAIDGVVSQRRPPVYRFEPELFDSFHDFFRNAIWVHIDRRDVFAQAVSMYFAESRNLWENRDANVERPADAGEPSPYDRDTLLRYLRAFLIERQQWEAFFRHYGITPLRLTYEDAVADYPGYLDEFFATTGLTRLEPPPPRRMHKVGGDVNEEYARRLREEAPADLFAGGP